MGTPHLEAFYFTKLNFSESKCKYGKVSSNFSFLRKGTWPSAVTVAIFMVLSYVIIKKEDSVSLVASTGVSSTPSGPTLKAIFFCTVVYRKITVG